MNNGLTTIYDVRAHYENRYISVNDITKLKFKCWKNHSESRHKNDNPPFTYQNYVHHLHPQDIIEQINLDMIDCSDVGGKEAAIKIVKDWYFS